MICTKLWKKGQNLALQGQKNNLFWPFLQFFWLRLFSSEWIFLILIWCFWTYLEVICKKLWKQGQNSTLQSQKNNLFWPFLQFFGLRNFSSELIFLIFNMLFLGIFRSDLNKILKKGSNFEGLKKRRDFSISQKLA